MNGRQKNVTAKAMTEKQQPNARQNVTALAWVDADQHSWLRQHQHKQRQSKSKSNPALTGRSRTRSDKDIQTTKTGRGEEPSES